MLVFSVAAVLLSLFSVRVLYPSPVGTEAFVASSIPVCAGIYAAGLTWVVGRFIRPEFTWFEGVVITVVTFGATIATHVLLRGLGSTEGFVQGAVGLLFWGLILQGWYILPIGAALPWIARKVFGVPSRVRAQ